MVSARPALNRRFIVIASLFLTALAIVFWRAEPAVGPARTVGTGPIVNVDAKPIVDYNRPYSSAVCREDLEELAWRYPDLITLETLGRSIFGLDIHLVRLGTGANKVLVVGGTHAREWITCLLTMKMIEEYARAAAASLSINGYDVRRLLAVTSFLFIPMLNPDGVDICLNGLDAVPPAYQAAVKRANLGRRSYATWKANGRGVNLNIQFEAGWERAISLKRPNYEKYKGTAPESEPESKALADLVRAVQPDVVLAYHSSGNVIFWNYGQKGADYRRDLGLAVELGKLTGYRLIIENEYQRHGGLKDWIIAYCHRPAFTIEIGEKTNSHALPLTDFPQIWERNATTPLHAADWLCDH